MKLRGPLLLALAAASTACSTVDPAADARRLASRLKPAAMVLAVGPIDLAATTDGAELEFDSDSARFRDRLIKELQKLDCASEVVAVTDVDEAARHHADIYLKVKTTRPPTITYEGFSQNWWASGGLWLLTWAGGMAVDDSRYHVDLELDCQFSSAASRRLLSEMRTVPSAISPAFLERNDFFSWSTAQALLMPPFWTADDTETTSHFLTQQATRVAATELALHIKQNLDRDVRAKLGTVTFSEYPSEIGPEQSLHLVGAVEATDEISSVRIRVNGGELSDELLTSEVEFQLERGTYSAPFEATLPPHWQDGDNLLQVVVTAGPQFSRTMRLPVRTLTSGH